MDLSVQQAMALALQNHQAGRLKDAEAIYQRILLMQPGHAGALHHLGLVAHQQGRADFAVDYIRRSLVSDPENSSAESNLGAALTQQGRHAEAEAAYRRALQIKPAYPEAHLNLGLALSEQNRLEEAIASFRRALELRPDFPDACYNLGTVLVRQGRFDEAVSEFYRALRLRPRYFEALNNLGNALGHLRRLEEARTAYLGALEINPGFAEAHANLGAVLARLDRPAEAVVAYQYALQLRPNRAETYCHLGNALRSLDQLDAAVAAHRRALELKPDYAPAFNNLGNALSDLGKLDEALLAYQRGLALSPDCAEARYNFGTTLAKCRRLDEALVEFRRALELQPDYPEAYVNLGNALKDQGRLTEAVAACRQARELRPGEAWMCSNIVCSLQFMPEADEETIVREHQRWNRLFGDPLKRSVQPYNHDRTPGRRLRIGYVSPDFSHHVVGQNLLPLFQCHDRQQVEIFCYSGVIKPDSMTAEFRHRSDQWRDTVRVTDDAFAEMIRQDQVDILVDLTQHLANNRLPVFARQPAPVQVSFAGYPASAGVDAIGYRISDRYLEPKIEGLPRAEQAALIDSFWCYHHDAMDVAVNGLPAPQSGHVTFGSLNNFCKINEPVLKLWARILGAVNESRLALLTPKGSHQRTLEFLQGEGVEPHRVEFFAGCPRKQYLELYHRLDIALDPFPYNGHTTSLDALWMGVPVITLVGSRSVSRAGLSQLSNLGLEELAAFSEDAYIDTAVQLAHDLPHLAELRRTLRSRMEASVLMDAPRFARGIEAAYRAMWQKWVGRDLNPEPTP